VDAERTMGGTVEEGARSFTAVARSTGGGRDCRVLSRAGNAEGTATPRRRPPLDPRISG